MGSPELWYSLILLSFLLCAGAWHFFLPNRQNLLMLVGWSGIIAILMIVYVLRDELQEIPRRIAAEFGLVAEPHKGQSQLYPLDQGGHAMIKVIIADTTIPMLLDTGASAVMLGRDDAARLGITPKADDYRHLVSTASGVEHMAKVRLPTVQIGNMLLNDVVALISPKSGISLLGMTALSRLEVNLSGDYVELKPKGAHLK